MCAHGAVQAIINDGVIRALSKASTTDADHSATWSGGAPSAAESARQLCIASAVAAYAHPAAAAATAAEAVTAVADLAAAARDAHAIVDWSFVAQRSRWVKKLDPHYVMGLVGLLASFNDDKGTSLKDVKAKFDEAIALVPLIKEYL